MKDIDHIEEPHLAVGKLRSPLFEGDCPNTLGIHRQRKLIGRRLLTD